MPYGGLGRIKSGATRREFDSTPRWREAEEEIVEVGDKLKAAFRKE
jgi:hypothetical protein